MTSNKKQDFRDEVIRDLLDTIKFLAAELPKDRETEIRKCLKAYVFENGLSHFVSPQKTKRKKSNRKTKE